MFAEDMTHSANLETTLWHSQSDELFADVRLLA